MKNGLKSIGSVSILGASLLGLIFVLSFSFVQAANFGYTYSGGCCEYSGGNGYEYSGGNGYDYSGGGGSDYSGGNGYEYSGGNGYDYSGGNGYEYSGGDGYEYSGGNGYEYSGGDGYEYSGGNGYEYSGGNGYSYTPPNYTPPNYTPPNFTPPNYTPPNYTPPNYTPPTYTPPTYKPAPTCTLTINKYTVEKGESVTVTWMTKNASTVTLSHVGSVQTYGSHTFTVNHSGTYTLTVKGTNGQTITCEKSVTVKVTNPVCTLSADRTSLTRGENATLSWSTTHASHVSLTDFGNVEKNGSRSVNPHDTRTYILTVYGENGQTVTCEKTITVTTIPVHQAPYCTIVINQSYNQGYFNPNHPVTISWTSNNATTGWINNGVGSVTLNGSRQVYPTQTTVYTATFVGYNGQTVTCSVTINMNTPTTPYITLSSVPYTGLELGPIGTALYWGFLVLWCLFAAYLIVVKRIQNKVYNSVKSMLFGSDDEVTPTTEVAPSKTLFSTTDLEVIANTLRSMIEGPAKTTEHSAPVVRYSAPQADVIDDFVLSQINRSRHN